MSSNNLSTPGYFLKRLRDAGFIAIRLFQDYAPDDTRRWTIMVNPSKDSVMITCLNTFDNERESTKFLIYDGGLKWPQNFIISTSSINVIIQELKEHEISFENKGSKYYKASKKDDTKPEK